MISALLAVLTAYLGVLAGLFFFQRFMMYAPGRRCPSPADAGVPEMSEVRVETEDGLELAGWHHAPASAGRPTLVYLHGNAGTIGDRGSKVRPYLDAGMGVLLAGYRGYGSNGGSPTEKGLYADARAWLAFLDGLGAAPNDIVLYGESLGTAVAVQMAMERAEAGRPAGVLVLEAPFSSMGAAAQSHYPYVPAKWLVRDRYDSAAKIARVATPVFIFHGDADRTVPIRLGRALFAAAREPKESLWLAGAGHNDLYDFKAGEAVLGFLRRYLNADLASPRPS